ncbi:MAG: hypothetical protein M3Y64_07560, partial [Gemmatimonadota bacterium]|nr:hypothetical protein [Gemmatimonadota bacterium]
SSLRRDDFHLRRFCSVRSLRFVCSASHIRRAAAAAALGLVISSAAGAQATQRGDTAAKFPPRDTVSFPRRSNSPESEQARQAQDAFEQTHRQGLRFYNGGADATCEEQINRICYWNNNGDVPPPAERNDARIERMQLIEILGRAEKANPNDDWVVGMLVRYDIEADRPDSALKAARACTGTGWWCSALQGLSLHILNQHLESKTAFDKMLRTMPDSMRCSWTEIALWISSDSTVQRNYRARPCDQRMKDDERLFRLAQPLWALPANDLYNELLSRHTISTVHGMGRIPYDLTFGPDLLESQVRYGWPVNWSVQNGGVADPRPPQVIGHEPTPSYDFLPSANALANPTAATVADFPLFAKKARMRYAPRYASGFQVPPYQFARFRRGDTTVVAGAYRLIRDLEMGRPPYNATLALDAFDGSAPIVLRRDNAPANAALLVHIGAKPYLASLEVLAPASKRVTRVRTGVDPLPKDRLISDVLLLTKGDPSTRPNLESAAALAFGGADIDGGTTIGLYWETYLKVSPSSPGQTSIRATRLNASFLQRLSSSLKLSKAVQPVSQRFQDQGRPDNEPGRTLALGWPEVPAGDYQLTIVVQNASGKDSTSTIIKVRDKNR